MFTTLAELAEINTWETVKNNGHQGTNSDINRNPKMGCVSNSVNWEKPLENTSQSHAENWGESWSDETPGKES